MMIFFFRNMIDRYVNDEFRAVDRDFSNCKTLIIFYLCRKCLLHYRFFCYVLFKEQSLKKTLFTRLISIDTVAVFRYTNHYTDMMPTKILFENKNHIQSLSEKWF